jgi:WD40 repeat protein
MRFLLTFSVLFFTLTCSSTEPIRDSFGDPLPEGAITRLGTARFRHVFADQITATPGGKTIVTAGNDGRVCIWDSANGKLLETYRFPYLFVDTNHLSPDGRRYIEFRNRHIEVWDLKKKECTHRLPLKEIGDISAIAFSLDENVIATVDDTPREYRIRVWDLKKGTSRVIGATEDRVSKLTFVDTSQYLVTQTTPEPNNPKTVIVWDVVSGDEKWRQETHQGDFTLSSNGRWLAIQEKSSSWTMWDLKTLEEKKVAWPKEKSWIKSISPDGRYLVYGEHNDLWDSFEGKRNFRIEWRSRFTFSSDSKFVFTVAPVIQKRDVSSGKSFFFDSTDSGHLSEVNELVWSGNSQTLVSRSIDFHDKQRIWDFASTKTIRQYEFSLKRFATTLVLSANGKRVFVGEFGPTLFIGELDSSGKSTDIELEKLSEHQGKMIQAIHLSPDERKVMILTESKEKSPVRLLEYDLTLHKVAQAINTNFSNGSLDFARKTFSSDARILASGKSLWLIPSLQELPVLESVKEKPIRSPLALSKDTFLVAGGHFQIRRIDERSSIGIWSDLTIWERITGRVVAQLPSGPFFGMAFHPNGQYLASSHSDGIRIWDLLSGKQIHFIQGHEQFHGIHGDTYASSLAFSPDEKKLASGHLDTTILIWDVEFLNKQNQLRLDNQELEILWKQLLDSNPSIAHSAIGKMSTSGEKILPFLKEKFQPVQSNPMKDFDTWLTKLNSDTFRVREQAMKDALLLGDALEPSLRETLKKDLTEEQKQRIKKLLNQLSWKDSPQGENLRSLRSLRILERIRTSEAISLVERLSKESLSVRVTEEAKATLARCQHLYPR